MGVLDETNEFFLPRSWRENTFECHVKIGCHQLDECLLLSREIPKDSSSKMLDSFQRIHVMMGYHV